MAGKKIAIDFGAGTGVTGDRRATRSGGARRAFARLFAATASLSGAAMTAKTIAKAAATEDNAQPCRSARGRTVCTSRRGIGQQI